MKQYKLGRKKSNRSQLIKNLTISLFAYERITTTLPKAKLTQRNAERIIAKVLKLDNLNGYKLAMQELGQNKIAKKMTEVLKEKYKTSNGGYTRILHIGNRKGDNAKQAILELTKKMDTQSPDQKTPTINDKSAKESVKKVDENGKNS